MARLFNLKVFDEYIEGTSTYTSSHELNDTLGRADALVVQADVMNSSGTTPTLTLKYWHSNDGRSFVTQSTLINAADISSTPYQTIVDTGTGHLAAFGRLELSLGGTTPAAYVRITVCGRVD